MLTRRLENKIILITGGTSGIGLASAKRLIQEGATVIITGRNPTTLKQVANSLGDSAYSYIVDVSKTIDLKNLILEVQAKFDRIDVLFANAGAAHFSPIENETEESFDLLFNVNLKGLYFTVQHALPVMSSGGSIILNSSVTAQLGIANTSVYSATKAAIRSLGRTLAAELAPRSLRVNVISPGFIQSPLWGKVGLNKETVKALEAITIENTPLNRTGRPEEIASTVAFLASDDSSFYTGAELVSDGGLAQV